MLSLIAAEFVEERVLTERNVNEFDRGQTQSWVNTMLGLARVRENAKKDKEQSFTSLMHHLTPALLRRSYDRLKRKAATGIDGVSWDDYQEGLENRLLDLHARVQKGRYKPKAARRVYIAKGGGEQRPLSIQSLEDKIVQQAVVLLFNEIYETDFLGFSYGFRPGRSQHNALDALAFGINKKKVNWVLDLDLRRFFDTVEHDWLIKMIQHRVHDKRLVKLITRWIKVGVIDDDGKRQSAHCGLPQGAVISPLLSNIYLHYVFDVWSHRWRQDAKGQVLIVRYADDAVLCFENKSDANEYLDRLNPRLSKFGLALHPEKTRLIRFGRHAVVQCAQHREGKPKSFDFLGFTHYCTKTRKGGFKLGRKTIKKRLINQIKAVQAQLRRRMHDPTGVTLKWLRSVLTGHMNYYSVPGNFQSVSLFHFEIVKRWFKMLRRRSQRYSITWDRFGLWVRRFLPKVRIVHPYPEARFRARYSK
jgi:RNA-directed DNA polymerase